MKRFTTIFLLFCSLLSLYAGESISCVGRLILIAEGESPGCGTGLVYGLETGTGSRYMIHDSNSQPFCENEFSINDTLYKAGEWVVVIASQMEENPDYGSITMESIQKTGLQYFLPRDNAYLSITNMKYHFSGDTLIDGMRYIKIYEQYCYSDTDCSDQFYGYYAAVREDTIGGRIYCRFEENSFYTTGRDKSEVLLADFSVKAGDRVPIVYTDMWWHDNREDYVVEVKSVDSILIGNEYRKRINIDTRFSPYFPDDSWVDGIGSIVSGLFFPSLAGLIADWGAPPYLLCMHAEGRLIYEIPYQITPYHTGCYMDPEKGWISIPKISVSGFKLYPNPAGDEVTVTSTEPMRQISLYDGKGALLFEQSCDGVQQVVLPIAPYPTGIYCLTVALQSGIVKTEKLVVK